MLNNAVSLNDLRIPPANRLAKLGGERAGQDSIRINDRWRVCFVWRKGDAYGVEIVLGKRAITADTALRLARYFGTSPRFWLGLQSDYDLDAAEDLLGDRLAREVRPMTALG